MFELGLTVFVTLDGFLTNIPYFLCQNKYAVNMLWHILLPINGLSYRCRKKNYRKIEKVTAKLYLKTSNRQNIMPASYRIICLKLNQKLRVIIYMETKKMTKTRYFNTLVQF